MGSGLETVIGRVLMVGARVSALMVFAPFLASATIAPRIKAGIYRGADGPPLPRRRRRFTLPLRGPRVAGCRR